MLQKKLNNDIENCPWCGLVPETRTNDLDGRILVKCSKPIKCGGPGMPWVELDRWNTRQEDARIETLEAASAAHVKQHLDLVGRNAALQAQLSQDKELHAGLSAAYEARGDELDRSHMQCMELSKQLSQYEWVSVGEAEKHVKYQTYAYGVVVHGRKGDDNRWYDTKGQSLHNRPQLIKPIVLPKPEPEDLPECKYQRQERNVTMCHNVHSVHVNQPCSKRCIFEPKNPERKSNG